MECFFCKLPLTSDDFKQDKVEEAKSFIAHRDCVTEALQKFYRFTLEDILGDVKIIENFKSKYTN